MFQADNRDAAKEMLKKFKLARTSSGAGQVHRVSRYLMSEEDGCLGSDFRDYVAGAPMSRQLRTEITAYQLCMLDDSLVEGPHARIGRVTRYAVNSKAGWWSASLRMEQNNLARAVAEQTRPQRFDTLFAQWKVLGQSDPKAYSRGRCQRISHSKFIDMVYRTNANNMIDWSAVGIGRAEKKAPSGNARPRLDPATELKHDFVRRLCQPGKYFTIPGQRSDQASAPDFDPVAATPVSDVAIKVISTDIIWKKHVFTDKLSSWRSMAVPASVQHFSVRRGAVDGDAPLDVYEEGHPVVCDLMQLAPYYNIRDKMRSWNLSPDSDLDGCSKFEASTLLCKLSWYSACMCQGC